MLTAGVVIPDGPKIAVTEGRPEGCPLPPLLHQPNNRKAQLS
jgi:hypothetical protein